MNIPINKIICGDCLDVMPTLADGSVGMVLADVPYGTTACKWDSIIPIEPMWEQLKRVIKPNGAIVMTASQPFTTTLIASNMKMFKYCWYWQKDRASNHLNAKKQPMRNIEEVVVFNSRQYRPIMENWGEPSHSVGKKKGKVNTGTTTGDFIAAEGNTTDNIKYPRTLLYFPIPHPRIHPTQKPVALMEYLIKTYTNEGETVLDFTMGSGTTGVACVNLGRNFIGIEMDAEYFRSAENRIKQALQGKKGSE